MTIGSALIKFQGLWSLHKAGYVHRDISTGNILVDRSGVGAEVCIKISDLEYMRKLSDLMASGDVKTVCINHFSKT